MIRKNIFYLLLLLALFGSCQEMYDFRLLEENIEFTSGKNLLKGVMAKPCQATKYPVVIFVHGDGAADRYQNGYYKFIWRQLNNNGIACMAWDKAGVGKSTGNWKTQSINDRAKEVAAAIRFVKQRTAIDSSKIILWGISQGGWVVPKAFDLAASDVRAVILQSAAVNWLRQGKYHLKCLLKSKAYTSKQDSVCWAFYDAMTNCLKQKSYPNYQQLYNQQPDFVHNVFELMDKERWQFVVKNYQTDITNDLKKVFCPTLALFGAEDENVDTKESVGVFTKIFKEKGNRNYRAVFFDNADHALLNISEKGKNGTTDDVWYKLLYKGKDVFAPGFINRTIRFINTN